MSFFLKQAHGARRRPDRGVSMTRVLRVLVSFMIWLGEAECPTIGQREEQGPSSGACRVAGLPGGPHRVARGFDFRTFISDANVVSF